MKKMMIMAMMMAMTPFIIGQIPDALTQDSIYHRSNFILLSPYSIEIRHLLHRKINKGDYTSTLIHSFRSASDIFSMA